ncbi:YwqG family protein [Actinomadura sp. LOL_016]|uniref:YwqG family protein n=1 Tax=unclassified Actinomadura TaxID=2626254 RepID=UPI003A80C5F6
MDDFTTQRRRLRHLFELFLAPAMLDVVLPLARPALRLAAGEGTPAVDFGGTPHLPPGEPWPEWGGRPLDFLGVIDFADLPAPGEIHGVPATGSAAFYYASEVPRPWGDEAAQRDGWRVFTGALERAAPPPGAMAFPRTRLHAAPFLSLPSPQEPTLRRLEMRYPGLLAVYAELHTVWSRYLNPGGLPVHQLGGWPALVQRPIEPDCLFASTGRALDSLGSPTLSPEEARAADDWRLLLQLDSDQRLGWYWGDPGRVYFCGRRDDPLEDAWLTVQAA